MRFRNYFIVGWFLFLASLFVIAGDVIVKDGELNVTQDFFVDTEVLFVDSTNNYVGIGTSNPSSTLDVVGDIEVSGSRLHSDSSGNIGINTTSPTHTLNSVGTFNITRADGDAQVYENSTCVIVKGKTSTMEIC